MSGVQSSPPPLYLISLVVVMDYNLCLVFHRAKQLMTSKEFPCYDYEHVLRVYKNAVRIGGTEEADRYILEPAAIMHDLGRADEFRDPNVDHAVRSAELAEPILYEAGFPAHLRDAILIAIRQHRFSTGIIPDSLEGKVLQDADRLDALGAIGIIRWVKHSRAKQYYHPDDPLCKTHVPDDKVYAADHFHTKLLRLMHNMHTESARKIAVQRTHYMYCFLEQLAKEI